MAEAVFSGLAAGFAAGFAGAAAVQPEGSLPLAAGLQLAGAFLFWAAGFASFLGVAAAVFD
ncbi:MAG: hypothetical protein IOC86_13885 [Aestuariivirga sp.]|nr:hypothetical protein [Aestuariivirga sp.]